MTLSINTHKVSKESGLPFYKSYRYATIEISEDDTEQITENINHAIKVLISEIREDKNNNDLTKYYSIDIDDFFFS